eukprot:15440869-Alexandrium_andersonii.AAC.1
MTAHIASRPCTADWGLFLLSRRRAARSRPNTISAERNRRRSERPRHEDPGAGCSTRCAALAAL